MFRGIVIDPLQGTRELVGDLMKRLTHGIIQQMSVSGRGLGLRMSQ
jgi:hypothetical protein